VSTNGPVGVVEVGAVGLDARTVVDAPGPAFLLEVEHPVAMSNQHNPMTSTGTEPRPSRTFGDATTLQGPNRPSRISERLPPTY